MFKNHLKELLDAGKPAFGIQLRFGSPAIVELAGLAGFDWVLIDSEHAPQTPVTIQGQLQAAGCTPVTPVVRIGKSDPGCMQTYFQLAFSIQISTLTYYRYTYNANQLDCK